MNTDTTQRSEHLAGRKPHTLWIVVGLSVLVVAIASVVILLMGREPPERVAAEVPIPGADVSQSDVPEAPAGIRSRGVVAPKVRIQIMPEVAGRVVYVHSQLHAGGLIRANEKIAQIDSSGYDLAVRRARAAVDEAQAKLDLELAAAGMRPDSGRSFNPEAQTALPAVLHEPRVRQAAAALESAQAELATAELRLSQTSVVLPYDVLIAGDAVSLGQYVGVGRSLAAAYGTEAFEIEAPVRSEDLNRLGGLEGLGLAGEVSEGSRVAAEVRATFAGVEHTWTGEVVRTTGRVDPESGMVSVVVEVPWPLDVGATGSPTRDSALGGPMHASPVQRPPLLPGMAVEVLIDGDPAAGAAQDTGNMGEF